MNNKISFELNKYNIETIFNLAEMLYERMATDNELPKTFCRLFSKYVREKEPSEILFNAIFSNDNEKWLRDVVTYGIINDLIKGLTNIKLFNNIIKIRNNDAETFKFWQIVYKFFGLNAETDTITENDILARFDNNEEKLLNEMNTPCNELIAHIFNIYYTDK